MNAAPYRIALWTGLGMVFATAPAFAQGAMQGMDTPPTQHAATKPPAKKIPGAVTKSQSSKKKVPAHSMAPMDMPAMPGMTTSPQHQPPHGQHAQHTGAMSGVKMAGMPVQPRPHVTGQIQKLAIGSELGLRPVVRGLNLVPMPAGPGMSMHAGKAPPGARSADYSDGIGYGSMPGMDMPDDKPLAMVLIDHLGYFHGRTAGGVALDAQGWYGTDANKLWFKAEGAVLAGHIEHLRTEALWDHPVGAWWDAQLGVRHDLGAGPDRTWAAFGVQGLAPFWFDVEATFYVGQGGRTAFRFESEYELRLTQRAVLQPRLEVNVYGQNDARRGLGAGLSGATLGLRLRYAITRKFAPYVGVELGRTFGKTANLARHAGKPAFDPRLVAGLHLWF